MSDSFVTPWTVVHQALLSMGFSWQEYWSGLPCPSPGDLPNLGTEPTSLVSPELACRFYTTEPPGKPLITIHFNINEIILYIIFFILTLSSNNMIQMSFPSWYTLTSLILCNDWRVTKLRLINIHCVDLLYCNHSSDDETFSLFPIFNF